MGDGSSAEAGAAQASARDVFISYASPDVQAANRVCTALEAAGVSCWIAPRNVMPGDLYADAIVRGLNAARVLVLLLSEKSVASPHVLREVERASAKRRALVTLRLDTAELTSSLEYFLSASHWLDASAGLDDALPTLVDSVCYVLQPPAAAPALRDGSVVGNAPVGSPVTGRGLGDVRSALTNSRAAMAAVVLISVALAFLFADRFWLSRHPAASVADGTGSVMARPAASEPAISDRAIAVMPFADLSEKKDQEYFADGLAEELIDLLAKVPDLRVAARTSSFFFKSKQITIADVAKSLGVAHVLEGSVRKSGNVLRVSAQLIRADNGFHVWSETYDRQVDDIFKVQDDIAGAVVSALKVSLFDKGMAKSTPAANTEAYNEYLQGRFFGQLHTRDGTEKALRHFQSALRLDPKYEPAWSGIALAYGEAGGAGILPNAEASTKSRDAAHRALAIDPKSPRAHVALGLVHMNDEWDWRGADREFGLAVAEDPGNATVLVASGALDLTLGRTGRAAELFKQATDRDPLHASSFSNLGIAYFADGRLDDAEAAFRKSIELKPGQGYSHNGLALVMLARQQNEAALAEMQLETDESWRLQGLAIVYTAMGRSAEAGAALAELKQRFAEDAPYQIATVHAYRGELDEAFRWLERAYSGRDSTLASIRVDPLMKRLTGDARYRALLARLRFPAG